MRSLLPAVLIFAVASPLLTACDRWALIVNSDGLIFISVINDGDRNGGFRVRARESDGTSRIMDVPPSGNLSLDNLSRGPIELTLLAPEGCSVSAPNPRTITTDTDDSVNVGFEVHCS